MQLRLPHQEKIEDENTRQSGQENGPAGKHGNKCRNVVNIIPRTNSNGYNRKNETTASDVDPSRAKSSHIHTGRDGVQDNAKGHLRGQEAQARKESASASSRGHGYRLDVQKKFEGVPEVGAVDLLAG